MVSSFVEGENGTVATFGPTQSGKTFTLYGKIGVQRGVIPRAVEDVLNIVKADLTSSVNESNLMEALGMATPTMSSNSKLTPREKVITTVHTKGAVDPDIINERVFLRMSVYMIYCDRIFDLIGKSQSKVKLEQYIDRQSQQVVSRFVNLSEKLIMSLE